MIGRFTNQSKVSWSNNPHFVSSIVEEVAAGHLFKLSKMESDKKHFTTRILYFEHNRNWRSISYLCIVYKLFTN